MIFIVLAFVIAVMVYSDFYSYDFLNSLLNDKFGTVHIFVFATLFMVVVINILLNLRMYTVDKKYFQKTFETVEEFNSQVRRSFLYNSISRLLLILIIPLFGYTALYLFGLAADISSGFLKWVFFILIGMIAIITFTIFYVSDIMFPMNMMMCGEIGFFSFCKECKFGGVEVYKEEIDNQDGYMIYKCKNCGNEIKIEKAKHVFNQIFRHIHLHRHK